MSVPDIYRARAPELSQRPPQLGAASSDRLDFRALISTFRRRLWLFAVVAVVIAVAVAAIMLSQAPQYTADARVMLNTHQQQAAPKSDNDTTASGQIDTSAVDTEVEVLRSRSLGRVVVKALNLDQDPDFNPMLTAAATAAAAKASPLAPLKAALSAIKSHIMPPKPAPAALNTEDIVVDNVLAGLTTQRIGVTYAIVLSYTASDPTKAQRIANAFAHLYTRQQIVQKIAGDQEVSTLLHGRIDDLRQQAEADTAAVQEYRIQHNLLTTTGASLTEQEISTYNQSVAAAKAQAAEDQARLDTARAQLRNGSSGDDVGEALSSGVISSLRAQRATVSQKVADLSGRYGDNHPQMLTAKRQLADIDSQIQAEINRVISNLEARAQVSRQRLASIEGTLGAARGSLAQNNKSMIGLDDLQRKATTSQTLYENYLNALKESAAQEGAERSDARVISEAQAPLTPSSPKVLLSLALATVLGLAGGTIAAFLAEAMTSAFTTGEELEERLGLPFLGSIPLVNSIGGAGRSPLTSVVTNPLSAYAESFRSLRTAINHAGSGPAQVLMVTSSLPAEGKTTTAVSLARSAAVHDQSVVLVDCDVRRRALNQLVRDKAPKVGLLEVLAGDLPLDKALYLDECSGCYILPFGSSERSAGDMLAGLPMDQLLAKLRGRFDLIVLDTAPILPIADTRSLAAKADRVLMGVLWRKTQQQAVRSALRLLPQDDLRMAGVFLTMVDMRKQPRYGYGDASYYFNKYKDYYA